MSGQEHPNDEQNGIPVIDMGSPDSGDEILEAFQTIGFATLTNHGIPPTLIKEALEQSKCFFELPLDQKLKYRFQGYESNRGYIPAGMEKHDITKKETPDKKETFDIGNERETEYDNQWPTEADYKFKETMLHYFDSFDALHLRIMKLLAVALKMQDPDFFVNRCNGRHENLRLLHYPSIDTTTTNSSEQPLVRGAVHTDFGTITLLTQDGTGGLRAQRLDGSWLSVPPLEGSIVVNVGDMLQRWSNDRLRATPHQVVEQHSSCTVVPERCSIAFFCNANKNVLLECLEECVDKDNPAKYPPINAHEYLTMRLAATISKEASSSS